MNQEDSQGGGRGLWGADVGGVPEMGHESELPTALLIFPPSPGAPYLPWCCSVLVPKKHTP
jgi:hypothetical protein